MGKEIDEAYVREMFPRERYPWIDENDVKVIIATMKKYGEHRWWELEDPVEFARNQIYEKILLGEGERYLEGLQKLLRREVAPNETYQYPYGLQEELAIIEAQDRGLIPPERRRRIVTIEGY
ncbi:MAG: hypothetical protein HY515_01755 [Candidatus Aenigmarchaeota archaeon]|nr:hypothetical protein [Candidatus Aenigmarchaeota archaeon]